MALAFAATSAAAAPPPKVFAQCAGCHAVEKGAKSVAGPNLAGVVGRKAAADKAFTYTPALKKLAVTWTPKTLDRFLTDPAAMAPGTSMGFVSLKKPADRAAVIAYLKSHS